MPVTILDKTFKNQAVLRNAVQSLLDRYPFDAVIGPSSPDFAFLHAVMQRHPSANEKLNGLTFYSVGLYQDYGKMFKGFYAHCGDIVHSIGWVKAVKGR